MSQLALSASFEYLSNGQQLHIFNYFSAGIDFKRQYLASPDVRRLKSVPALKGLAVLFVQFEL